MSEDNMRAKFEAWITSPPLEKPVHRNPESSGFPGQYWEYEVQLAWDAWQARAQLAEGADATGDLHTYIAGMRAALRSGDWRKAKTRAELERFLSKMEAAALTAAGGREEWANQAVEAMQRARFAMEMNNWNWKSEASNDLKREAYQLIVDAIAATQPAKEGKAE